MDAFHTFRVRGNYGDFALADFELFIIAISALEWRKHNGFIKLETDSAGVEYLYKQGLTDVWDSTEVILDGIKSLGIDEDVFWAGAKMFALSQQKSPCVMLDLDFILWKSIDFDNFCKSLAVIHREDICPSVYPSKKFFHFQHGWQLPNWLDWSVRPCNGALVYFGSQHFIREYTAFALEFMQVSKAGDDRLRYMVFAEQRWMAMCAEHLNVPIQELSTLEGLFDDKQKYFTHIWGYKQRLRDNPKEADEFCRKCARRLAHDFPDFYEKLARQVWASRYWERNPFMCKQEVNK